MTQTATPTRRQRRREATLAEIVESARGLLRTSQELSLRAVAAQMGVTAPALYRYVASYQDLVDLVAFEIDRAVTEQFRAAADRHPAEDPGARLITASVAFRAWALAQPREFSLVFANPIAGGSCVRREMLTSNTSGHYMNDLLLDIWEQRGFEVPTEDELDPAVAAALRAPLVPLDLERLPPGHPGLLWVFMSAWAALYGVVTLEVFGHLDPRVIESGAMFRQMVVSWLPRLGMADDAERYAALLDAEMGRA